MLKNSSTRAVSVPINLSIKLCFVSVNSPRETCYVAELILQPFRHFTYVTTHSPTLPSLYLLHSSFSNPSVTSPTSQYILQPFFRFSYVTSSSLNSPGEPPKRLQQLILQPFRRFTYVTAHSLTLPLLYLPFSNPSFASPTSQALHLIQLASRPSGFSNSFSSPSVVLPTSQLILPPFRCLINVTAHSPTLPSLYLCHSSFFNPSVALLTSQLILQPFFHFSYVTGS